MITKHIKMPKLYQVKYYNDEDSNYILYHKDENYIYLVCIDDLGFCSPPHRIRIPVKDKNKKRIHDYTEDFVDL